MEAMSHNDANDWLPAVDDRGRTYYYHKVTRETTWYDPFASQNRSREANTYSSGSGGAISSRNDVADPYAVVSIY